jgi:outer membrane lipoprotein-sorting protein
MTRGGNVRKLTSKWTRAAAVALALLAFGGRPALSSAGPDPQQILEAAEKSRTGGWTSFAMDVKITDEGTTGPRAVTNYQVLVKGVEQTLIKFTDPSDKGKLLLMVEDGMWFYLPSASRPIRVTPLQKLAGNASNGDVAQTDFAILYAATLVGEETLDGKPAWVLELTAKRKSATYHSVRYWVAKEGLVPLQAELRLTSDKPSKLARFEEYEQVGGRRLLKRQVIVDLLRNEHPRTVLEFHNYAARQLPDRLFNKNYLGEL